MFPICSRCCGGPTWPGGGCGRVGYAARSAWIDRSLQAFMLFIVLERDGCV